MPANKVYIRIKYCYLNVGISVFKSLPANLRMKKDIPKNVSLLNWCARRDLNPHGRPLDPKSSASANSATRARMVTPPGIEPGLLP